MREASLACRRHVPIILALVVPLASQGCDTDRNAPRRSEVAQTPPAPPRPDNTTAFAGNLVAQAEQALAEMRYRRAKDITAYLAQRYGPGYLASSRGDSVRRAADRGLRRTLSRLDTSYDKVERITWYSHKNSYSPYYDRDAHRWVYAPPVEVYFADDGTHTWARIRMSRSGPWILTRRITVAADDERYELSPEYSRIKRRGNEEEYDVLLDEQMRTIALAIARSRETIIRWSGEGIDDVVVTSRDKKMILDMLDAYQSLERYDAP